jgi:ABC-type transport system involved in cytochrome c biogenesis permease subunit
MAWAAAVFLAVYLGFRWKASGLPPASNMWEYTVAFGWAVVLFGRFVDWRFRAWGLNLILLAGALVLFGVAEAAFSSKIGLPHVHLQANRHLLTLHVSTMLVAFGAFAVAFAGGAGFLVRRFAGGPKWLPADSVLEAASNWAVALGFVFYTSGLAFGSYWMYTLWGRYWDWDAKAASSLVAWLTYAAYFHARGRRGWRGPTAPLLLIAGFATVMFSYFGVNLW